MAAVAAVADGAAVAAVAAVEAVATVAEQEAAAAAVTDFAVRADPAGEVVDPGDVAVPVADQQAGVGVLGGAVPDEEADDRAELGQLYLAGFQGDVPIRGGGFGILRGDTGDGQQGGDGGGGDDRAARFHAPEITATGAPPRAVDELRTGHRGPGCGR
ncbi:MAG: hypothetical protein E6Q56_13285 [Mycobacterium sp.]|nr:MAG: hypothetical protein E6Q56_13285 [Mycobacterium sp.]